MPTLNKFYFTLLYFTLLYYSLARKKEKFEDTKMVIGSRKSKDRQYNGQMKKDKSANNNLQNATQKTKYWVTRTPINTEGELTCSGRVGSSASTNGTCRVTVAQLVWFQIAELVFRLKFLSEEIPGVS